MFDGSFFQLAAQDAVLRATCITAAGLLFGTGMVAVIATLMHIRRDARDRRDSVVEAEWRPVIKAVLEGCADPDIAVAHVDPADRRHYLRVLLSAARQRSDHDASILKRMAAPFLDDIRCGTRAEAAEARAVRTQLLGWLGDGRDVPLLIEALDDPSPLVAIVALRALIRRRAVVAIDAMVSKLDRFRFWNVRTIASILAEIGPRIAPALRAQVIDRDTDMRIRLIGLTTLQEVGGETAVRTALDLLADEDDRSLITGSLRILEASGDPRHLPLLRVMSRSDDEIIRLRAYSALSAIDSTSEVDTLQDAFNDRNSWVAMRAAQALAQAGRMEVLERAAMGTSDRAELARQVLAERRRNAP